MEYPNIPTGDVRADAAATKNETVYHTLTSTVFTSDDIHDINADISHLQENIAPAECQLWTNSCCYFKIQLWNGTDKKTCLRPALFPFNAILSHGRDHTTKGSMISGVNTFRHTKEISS